MPVLPGRPKRSLSAQIVHAETHKYHKNTQQQIISCMTGSTPCIASTPASLYFFNSCHDQNKSTKPKGGCHSLLKHHLLMRKIQSLPFNMSSWPYIIEKDSPHGECRKGMRSSSLGVKGVLLKKIMDHNFSNLEILQVQSLFSPADGGFWAAWAGNLRLFGVSGPVPLDEKQYLDVVSG